MRFITTELTFVNEQTIKEKVKRYSV